MPPLHRSSPPESVSSLQHGDMTEFPWRCPKVHPNAGHTPYIRTPSTQTASFNAAPWEPQARTPRSEDQGVPAEDLEVVVGVSNALPDTLILSLHSHGEGNDDPAVLEVDGRGAIIGDVAQNQDLNRVVWQPCTQQARASELPREHNMRETRAGA